MARPLFDYRRRIWIIAAFALLAGLVLAPLVVRQGVAAWLARTDRPDAALGWDGNDTGAILALARRDLDEGRPAQAARRAQALLRLEPLNVGALEVIGLSVESDDRRRAILEQASRLSRRAGRSQAWLMDAAFRRGDYSQAFLQADLLLRRRVLPETEVFERMAGALRQPGSPKTLAERLRLDPPWRRGLIYYLGSYGEQGAAIGLFDAMARQGDPPRDEEAALLFRRILYDRDYGALRAAWRARYPKGGDQAVYDGGFEAWAGPPPFNWHPVKSDSGSAIWKMADGARGGVLMLRLDSARSSGPLVRQLVFLSPGRYRVTADASVSELMASERFRIEVRCDFGRLLAAAPLRASPGQWQASGADVVVPAAGCPAQWLQVAPAGGDQPGSAEMLVDNIAIVPVTGEGAR